VRTWEETTDSFQGKGGVGEGDDYKASYPEHAVNSVTRQNISLIKPPSPLPRQIHTTQLMETQGSVSPHTTPAQLPSWRLSPWQRLAWGSGTEDSPPRFCSGPQRAAAWGPVPKRPAQFRGFTLAASADGSTPGCLECSEPVFQGCLLTPRLFCVDSATCVQSAVLCFHLSPRVPPHGAQKRPGEHQTRPLAQIYRL